MFARACPPSNSHCFSPQVFLYQLSAWPSFMVAVGGTHYTDSHPWANSVCKSSTEPRTYDDGGACIVQGFLFNFFLVSSCLWLMFAMLDALIPIMTMGASNTVHHKRQRLYIYAAVTNIWSLILCALLAHKKNLGSTGALTFCGIGTSYDYSWGMFMGTIIGSGSILILLNCTLLYKVYRSSQTSGHDRSIRVYVRLTLIDVMFIVCTSVGLQPNFTARAKQDEWTTSIASWITCALSAGDNSRELCPRPDNLLSPSTWQTAIAFAFCFGIFLFVIFAGPEEFRVWLRCCYRSSTNSKASSHRSAHGASTQVHPVRAGSPVNSHIGSREAVSPREVLPRLPPATSELTSARRTDVLQDV